jgi:hypothetical protein
VIEGRCLCGAVTVRAERTSDVSACHCGICRRWSGTAFAGVDAARVEVEGPARTYRSSTFAERAWCESCGTALWFRIDGEAHELSPGLFEEGAGWPLAREVYADRAGALSLAAPGERVSAAEYERGHAHV